MKNTVLSYSLYEMNFLCDDMLGTLAKWLRILGYDTKYGGNNDQELLDISRTENRILLTRDKILYQRAKNILLVFYIDNVPLEDQLALTLKKTGATIDEKKMFSRCIRCNVPVIKKNKSDVEKKIPFFVLQGHDTFLQCPSCLRVYWKGSHWENIKSRVQNLMVSHKL